MSPVMDADDRRELVATLEEWARNAAAGVQCATDVPPKTIALIKRPSDEPEPVGGNGGN